MLSLRSLGKLAIFGGMVVLIGVGIVSTGAYTSIDSQRSAEISAGDDGMVKIDPADTAYVGQRCPLVTITNRLDRRAEVTVSLVNGATGQLYADGQQGDTVSFWLNDGGGETVDLQPSKYKDTISYTIDVLGAKGNTVLSFGTKMVAVERPPQKGGESSGGSICP